MDKQLVATVLSEIGTLLALKGENSFRCNAYHAAARAIEQMEGDLAEVIAAGKLAEIRGIGDTLQEKITILVTTGALPFYDDLRTATPPGLLEMLQRQQSHVVERAGFQRHQGRIGVVDHSQEQAVDPPVAAQRIAGRPEPLAVTEHDALAGDEIAARVGRSSPLRCRLSWPSRW